MAEAEAEAEGSRAGRLPRWTRQEILVLIQGKRMAESKGRRGGDPKWASVSSYCRMHGVNRGPVQCRKRWSNLAADFKKIKDWESTSDSTSFWSMRNDLRRQNNLPGFFDKEVFDILDPPPLFDSRRPDQAIFSEEDDEGQQQLKQESPSPSLKRKRSDLDPCSSRLIDVLDKNALALSAHLQAQNANFLLRKSHSDSLLSVLNKLADALLRISDKL